MVNNGRPLCGTGVEGSPLASQSPRVGMGACDVVARVWTHKTFGWCPTSQASGGQGRCPPRPTRASPWTPVMVVVLLRIADQRHEHTPAQITHRHTLARPLHQLHHLMRRHTTGMTSRPPTLNCSTNSRGTSAVPAATRIPSYGPPASTPESHHRHGTRCSNTPSSPIAHEPSPPAHQSLDRHDFPRQRCQDRRLITAPRADFENGLRPGAQPATAPSSTPQHTAG